MPQIWIRHWHLNEGQSLEWQSPEKNYFSQAFPCLCRMQPGKEYSYEKSQISLLPLDNLFSKPKSHLQSSQPPSVAYNSRGVHQGATQVQILILIFLFLLLWFWQLTLPCQWSKWLDLSSFPLWGDHSWLQYLGQKLTPGSLSIPSKHGPETIFEELDINISHIMRQTSTSSVVLRMLSVFHFEVTVIPPPWVHSTFFTSRFPVTCNFTKCH